MTREQRTLFDEIYNIAKTLESAGPQLRKNLSERLNIAVDKILASLDAEAIAQAGPPEGQTKEQAWANILHHSKIVNRCLQRLEELGEGHENLNENR